MRSTLSAVALAAAAFLGLSGNASAACTPQVCVGERRCNATYNYCPGAESCWGTVNFCPGADYCAGHVNMCDPLTSLERSL